MNAAGAKRAVGIVGLGIMGGAFAKNLAAAGWRVIGHDIDAARRAAAAAAGVEVGAGAGNVAREAPVIITSLPGPEPLDATIRDILAAKLPRRVVIDTSTLSLDAKSSAEQALRAGGHVMLDCPVSGTGSQAKTKDIVVYASGETSSLAAQGALFADFSREAHDLGAFGNGTRMKFVANLLVAIHNVATAEALVLGMKAGLDPRRIFELIKVGAGNSRVFELRGPMMAENRYDGDNVTMKVSIWRKDMQVIGDFARSVGCPTPLFSATESVYASALSTGHGGDDTASVCAVLEAMAGLERE